MDDMRESENDTVSDVIADDQDDNDADGLEMHRKLVWEYELSRGRWIKYENVINKKLK